MKEVACNFWVESAAFRCVPTTGAVTPDGSAIMDFGYAKEAVAKFQGIEADLGKLITSRGNHVHVLRPGLLSFPIQQFQWAGPSLQIIERSARQMMAIVADKKTLLPQPGCGPGQLKWEDVAKALAFLPDNILIVPAK